MVPPASSRLATDRRNAQIFVEHFLRAAFWATKEAAQRGPAARGARSDGHAIAVGDAPSGR